jgi:hypothetical protein
VNNNLGEMLGHGILRRLKAPLEAIMLDNLNLKIMYTQRKRKLMNAMRKFPKGSRNYDLSNTFADNSWEDEIDLWAKNEGDNEAECIRNPEEIIMYCILKQHMPYRFLNKPDRRDAQYWWPRPPNTDNEYLKTNGILRPLQSFKFSRNVRQNLFIVEEFARRYAPLYANLIPTYLLRERRYLESIE